MNLHGRAKLLLNRGWMSSLFNFVFRDEDKVLFIAARREPLGGRPSMAVTDVRCPGLPAVIVMMAILLMQPLDVRAGLNEPLTKRWADNGYGISLMLPADATILPLGQNPQLVWFDFGDGVTVTMMLDQLSELTPLPQVSGRVLKEVTFLYSPAVGVEDPTPNPQIAGREGRRFFLLVGEQQGKRLLYGQAMALSRPDMVLAFEIKAPAQQFTEVVDLFNRLLASVEIQSTPALARVQAQRLQAGEAWLKSVAPQTLKALSDHTTWQRIQVDGEDVGYQRIMLTEDTNAALPGVEGLQLAVQSRRNGEATRLDLLGEYFLSEDQSSELWVVKMTERPRDDLIGNDHVIRLPTKQPTPIMRTQTWTDTGVRLIDVVKDPATGRDIRNPRTGQPIRISQIQVTQESPVAQPPNARETRQQTEIKRFAWQVPPRGYLPQVQLHLLPYLLDIDTPDMAFYAYHPGLVTLTTLTVRIEPNEDGSFVAYVRPSPRHPEAQWIYDNQGRLIRQIAWNGAVYQPSNLEAVRALWLSQ